MTNTVTITESNNTVSILEDAPVVTPAAWYEDLKTIPTSSGSATVTAGGTSHTKGAWTEILASNGATTSMLFVEVSAITQGGTNTATLIDIGVGASGAESAIAENIAVGGAGFAYASQIFFALPIRVESGARISVRSQALIASDTAGISIASYVLGDTSVVPTTVDVLGTSTANSEGTSLSNTYTEVVASTSQEYSAIVIVESQATTASATTSVVELDVATGSSGSETAIAQKLFRTAITEFIQTVPQPFLLTQVTIPVGTRLAAKINIANTNIADVTLIGVPSS